MDMIETLCRGKLGDTLNEDALFIGSGFVAVIDGATDKSGRAVQGMAPGRFAATAVHGAVAAMPADATRDECVDLITLALSSALKDSGWPPDIRFPGASAVIYSRERREIWRVGDCPFRVGLRNYLKRDEAEMRIARIRALHVMQKLASGATVDEIARDDPGRKAILPLLRERERHANAEGPLGYAVLDGRHVPASLREPPVHVPEGETVILASDGLDFILDSLEDTERAQRLSYLLDPLRIGHDGLGPATKAIPPGATQHDDQTYARFLA